MKRVSFSLTDEQREALVETADERDESYSAVARAVFEYWLTTDPDLDAYHPDSDDDQPIPQYHPRIDQIEDRLRRVESELGIKQDTQSDSQASEQDNEYESNRRSKFDLPENTKKTSLDQYGLVNPDIIVDVVEELDIPGDGKKERYRRESVCQILAYLCQETTASAEDLRDIAWESGMQTYKTADSWWANCWRDTVYPQLEELGIVTLADRSNGEYRWDGID